MDVQSPRRTTFKHSPRVLPRPQPDLTSRPRVLEARSERDERLTRRLGMLGWMFAAVFLILGGVLLSHANGVATALETRVAGVEGERGRMEADLAARGEQVAAQAEEIARLQARLDQQSELHEASLTGLQQDVLVISEERDRVVEAIRFLEQQLAETPGPVTTNQPRAALGTFQAIEVLGMRLPPLEIESHTP